MSRWRNLLVAVTIIAVLVMMFPGCGGESEPAPTPSPTPTQTPTPTSTPTPEPSPAAQELSGKIAGINPAERAAFPELLGVSQELNNAQSEGALSGGEREELEDDLSEKSSDFIKHRVDEIDPSDPASLKDFFDLQTVQRMSEYDELCTPETKQYKEEQMGEKFNEWVRNRVDEIDPTDPNSLKDFFDLQRIQRTSKYEEFATSETHEYKEEQMGEKFNEWVRNRVDEIDPTDPNSLPEFFDLQRIQSTEKYDEFATPETHEYKESEMKRKFNEWVENRVNDLDPNDPDFLEELEKLRVIQLSDKYDRLCTTPMHEWKVQELKEKFADLVDALDPSMPNFMEKLDELTKLQKDSSYEEIWSKGLMQYKEEQLRIKLTKEPGEIPHVLGTLPGHEQSDVPVSQSILIAFDQPMEPFSVVDNLEDYPAMEYDLSWMDDNVVLILEPIEPWDFDTIYTVYIGAGAISEAGMLLEEGYKFNFTTKESGEAPQVMETLPRDGQADASGSQPLEIHFDQPMAADSLEAAIEISPAINYAILWQEENTIAVLHLLEPLGNDTAYTVGIGTEAMSADYIPLEESYRFSFFTGIHGAPHVLGTLPENGQADIPSNHPIQIVFDRPMNPAPVEAALEVSPNMDYSTTWLEANFVLLLEPLAPLAANKTYTFEIGTEAVSIVGLPMEEDFSFSFTTGG